MKNQHEFYMNIAFLVAAQSYCKRNQVGAIIVRHDNILSFGYNGTPAGFDNCCENNDDTTKSIVLHAESNAILKCAASETSANGATMYMTHSPCIECAKLIIQAKISVIYFMEEYRLQDGLILLKEAGIEFIQLQLQR